MVMMDVDDTGGLSRGHEQAQGLSDVVEKRVISVGIPPTQYRYNIATTTWISFKSSIRAYQRYATLDIWSCVYTQLFQKPPTHCLWVPLFHYIWQPCARRRLWSTQSQSWSTFEMPRSRHTWLRRTMMSDSKWNNVLRGSLHTQALQILLLVQVQPREQASMCWRRGIHRHAWYCGISGGRRSGLVLGSGTQEDRATMLGERYHVWHEAW